MYALERVSIVSEGVVAQKTGQKAAYGEFHVETRQSRVCAID